MYILFRFNYYTAILKSKNIVRCFLKTYVIAKGNRIDARSNGSTMLDLSWSLAMYFVSHNCGFRMR